MSSEADAARLVSKMSVHDQRYLMYEEGARTRTRLASSPCRKRIADPTVMPAMCIFTACAALLFFAGVFKGPNVKPGEKPPDGVNFDDLPVAEVYKLAVKAMLKRMNRVSPAKAMPLAH